MCYLYIYKENIEPLKQKYLYIYTIEMTTEMTMEAKICTTCHISKLNSLEYFYKGKNALRAECKICSSKRTVKNPNHAIRNKKYYKDNQEWCNALRMKSYIKNRTGVCLAN